MASSCVAAIRASAWARPPASVIASAASTAREIGWAAPPMSPPRTRCRAISTQRLGPTTGGYDFQGRRNRLADIALPALHFAEIGQRGIAPAHGAPGGCQGTAVVACHRLRLGDQGEMPVGFAMTRHPVGSVGRLGDRAERAGPVAGSRLRFGDIAKRNLLIHESPLTDALFLLVSKSDQVTTT